MKTCTCCEESKDESEFGKEPHGKNGLCSQCKNCVRLKRKAYRATPQGKEATGKLNASPAAKARKERWRKSDKGRANLKRRRSGQRYKERVYRYNHSEARRLRQARYNATPKRAKSLKRYEKSDKGKDVARKHKLKSKYQMTTTDYDSMLSDQNGVCAICGEPETSKIHGKVIPLSVDHDHTMGTVRGLLCARCNRMLGMADDRIELLFAAMGYLQTHKQKQAQRLQVAA